MLPVDILLEIFRYLPAVDVLQSFGSLNKYFSRIIMRDYLWHINIDDPMMSLSTFNYFCHHVLKLIGGRVISLRLRLTVSIGGWSLVSSSLRYHQLTLLQRLHLIDLKPHEFNKLLHNRLLKQLHTLLIDVTESDLFYNHKIEGIYLAKVCSQLPLLRICRLPFDYDGRECTRSEKHPSKAPMILPNLSNPNQLRTLTLGVHTLYFIERLLPRIPLIENLSIGISTFQIFLSKADDTISLPATVDADLLRYLSRLHIYCTSSESFHQVIALFSSVFGQLRHLSLKLEAWTFISGPLSISGDTIQQMCIDRLKPWATYALDLYFSVANDCDEKLLYNGFFQVPFVHRERPKVYIQEYDYQDTRRDFHHFLVFTSHRDTILRMGLFSTDLNRSWSMPINPRSLFPCANELFLSGHKKRNRLSELVNPINSVSSMVPWSLLTKISIDIGDVVTVSTLESILRMASNVHTLEICDERGGLPRAILRNIDNLGFRVCEQIKSLNMLDETLTLQNAQRFCTLLANRLPHLKKLTFTIYASHNNWIWIPPCIVDGKNKSTKRIVNLISYLVDHLKQLVSLHINFFDWSITETPCFPHLIRRQFYQYPLSRPYRLRCSSREIQMWF